MLLPHLCTQCHTALQICEEELHAWLCVGHSENKFTQLMILWLTNLQWSELFEENLLPGSYLSCFQHWTDSRVTVRWQHVMDDITGHRLSINREMTGSFPKCPNCCRDYVRKKQWANSSVLTVMFFWYLNIYETQNKWWNGKSSETVALTKCGFFHIVFNTKVSVLGQLWQFYSCCSYMVVLPHQGCHLWSFYTGPSASPTAASIFGASILWCCPHCL